MRRLVAILLAILISTVTAHGEIYVPPENVKDPARKVKARLVDYSLPFIYLEPHDFCYNITGPIAVTISVVNRSDKELSVAWHVIAGSLVLEPIGPGRVKPKSPAKGPDSVRLPPKEVAEITIDLRDMFTIEGASVYRLTYGRPLDDGRLHVASPAQFIIEDDAAIEKLATTFEAGVARDTFVALLKQNPVFAAGSEPKTYGWDALNWGERPQMHRVRWDDDLRSAESNWGSGIARLSDKSLQAGRDLALKGVIDRLLHLSDDFRAEPRRNVSIIPDVHSDNRPPSAECEELHLKFLRSRSPRVVARSINQLMTLRSEAALDGLFRIGDGRDQALALLAIGSLSSYPTNARITQYLRRKMTDADHGLALRAAIVTCYSGDSSGGGLVVRCLANEDPDLRLEAIAQVGDDNHFRTHRTAISAALLDELKQPMSIVHLERAIDSLGSYPSQTVLEAVLPFQKHESTQVARRADLTVNKIRRAISVKRPGG